MNTVEDDHFALLLIFQVADGRAAKRKDLGKNAQQDQSGGVKKVSVRQDRDDRIARRVKDPVIVAEQDLMEQYKTKIPVQSDKASRRSTQGTSEMLIKRQRNGAIFFRITTCGQQKRKAGPGRRA